MKISVITTSYNYANYIAETIESVLNQTYTDFEYVIFDDGSTDNSREIIKKYAEKDNRIKFYTHENNENKGLIKTLSFAIEKCSGDWIIFVESDDTIAPDYIEEKIKAYNDNPNAVLIFNQIKPVGDEKRVVKCIKHLDKVQNIIGNGKFDFYNLLQENIIPTFSCVMVKKDIITEIPFDFVLPKCFDWYLWNYIIKNYPVVFLNKKLTVFRLHTISYSCKKTNISVFNALIKLAEKKYNNKEIFYKLFYLYRENTKFEKLFKKFVKATSKYIYKKLYVQKDVEIMIVN